MKKIYLIIILSILLLTGCGSRQSQKKNTFIAGCDVSSLISEEASGVTYYNCDGIEQDIFKTLSENGVNTIRIRVFNNPYDSEGHGYGGGNNDISTAIAIGKRATEYDLNVMLDFHYSDFYADPSKQSTPKEWMKYDFNSKKDALYDFTYGTLKQMSDAGINVTMVQIGNETINGLCGETNFNKVCELLSIGCKSVKDFSLANGKDILRVLHFTNPEKEGLFTFLCDELESNKVDYDVFSTSYYPYWHGSIENLKTTLSTVAEKTGKKILIAETAYPYTEIDSDNFGNVISTASSDVILKYKISPEGQSDFLKDLSSNLSDMDCYLGFIYWEPAWIAIPGNSYEDRLPLWEKYGSGWASSYSAEYDKDGAYYGGSSWDNQALFDEKGHPLSSISVFGLIAHDFANKP